MKNEIHVLITSFTGLISLLVAPLFGDWDFIMRSICGGCFGYLIAIGMKLKDGDKYKIAKANSILYIAQKTLNTQIKGSKYRL